MNELQRRWMSAIATEDKVILPLIKENIELATALEALLAFEADYPILEDLRAYNAARDEARALLARLKGG